MSQSNGQSPAPSLAIASMNKLKEQFAFARDRLAEVAPKYLNVDRLIRLLLSACGRNPKIMACTPESILQFSMKCAETGLEPIGAGGCWPIPYENRKAGTCELTFIPDYRGLVHCAIRSGAITGAFAEVVRVADEFDYCLGLEPNLTHKPARGDRGALDAAYCIFTLPNGEKRFTVMDRIEIVGIRGRSKAGNVGPWVTDEGEMWRKTVIRRAMKPFAGMSSALDAAIEADDDSAGVVHREPVKMPLAVGEIPNEPTAPKDEPKPEEKKPRGRPKKEAAEVPVAAGSRNATVWPGDQPQPEEMDESGPVPPPSQSMSDWKSDANPAR